MKFPENTKAAAILPALLFCVAICAWGVQNKPFSQGETSQEEKTAHGETEYEEAFSEQVRQLEMAQAREEFPWIPQEMRSGSGMI